MFVGSSYELLKIRPLVNNHSTTIFINARFIDDAGCVMNWQDIQKW